MIFLAQARGAGSDLTLYIVGFLLLLFLVLIIFLFRFINLWIQAYLSKAPVSLFGLVGMQLRKVNPGVIVRAMVSSVQAGIPITPRELVVIGITASFHHRPSAHVGPADSQHDYGIDLIMNPIGDFEDSAEFRVLANTLIIRQHLPRQPKEPGIKRLFGCRDLPAVIVLAIRVHHFRAERQQDLF